MAEVFPNSESFEDSFDDVNDLECQLTEVNIYFDIRWNGDGTIFHIQTIECKPQSSLTFSNDLLTNNIFQSPIMEKKWPLKGVKTFMDLVSPGYNAEEHTIVTADGYILSLHRMSGSYSSPTGPIKPAVLFLHGMMGASDIWILRGPKQDLPYALVDNGYDVWMLNVRGNFYSKRHLRLSTRNPEFWKFSWHEVGVYDVPAAIDYILKLTCQSKLSLIGHSMGGTVELVLLSELPEYNSKLNVAIAWAPVALLTHDVPGLLNNFVFRFGNEIRKILDAFNIHEIHPRELETKRHDFVNSLLEMCAKLNLHKICAKLYELIFGLTDLEELDFSLLAQARHHYPQGTSVQTLSHYRQIIIDRQFRQYDFGPIANAMKYGSFISPAYPLNNISAPLVIYYGLDDPLSNPKDIQALLNKVPRANAKLIPHHKFGHLDFLLLNETKYFYPDVLKVLNYYNP